MPTANHWRNVVDAVSFQPGHKLAHYEILEPIGKGGMGEVYRARDGKLSRDVAIKVLPDEFARDTERLRRFQREAKVLASLNHPNIAAIYGVEQSESTHYLVLELVPGETLAERIARGPIPVDEAIELAMKIAEALESAHEQGIVHRDLKPANIKITPDGIVKVLDFGLAKAFIEDAADADSSMSPTLTRDATRAGVILGTAAYMSPEQAKGKKLDKRADVWAFGAVVYEMLTGKRAFAAEDVSDTLAYVLAKEADWDALPVDMSPTLRAFLTRCLEKDPKERVHDIADVRLAMQGAFEIAAAPATDSTPVTSRSVRPWIAATTVLTAVAAALAVWSLQPPEPRPVARFVHDLPEDQRFLDRNRVLLAIAPDGTRVAYTANNQLYLRNLDETTALPIPGTDEGPLNPFFSPDGEWIGYWASGQLKKIAVGGGVPVPLADMARPRDAVWGEDDTIVFGLYEGVMRVSANGGTPERLIAGDNMGGASMLPDGETLLFVVVGLGGVPQIAVRPLGSGERKMLLEGGRVQYVSTGHLVYGRDGALFAVPFDLDALELVGGPVPLVEGVEQGQVMHHYAISNTGTLVYVAARANLAERRVLALAGREGETQRLGLPPAAYLSPRLSPDGKRLAVQTFEEGVGVLWIYDLTAESAIQQFTFKGDNQRPLWTPDGERITFASDRDGTMSLYWKPADGSGVAERLTTADEGTSHLPSSWSPDGQVLAYMVVTGGDWDVRTLSLDGNKAESLYDVPDTFHLGPEFSPDGRWMAYGSGDQAARQDVYVEPFPPTGARRRISQGGGFSPMWPRAGTELYYRTVTSRADLISTLKVVDIVTEPDFAFSNERTLPLERFVNVVSFRDYDITPDGEKLLMVFPESVGESSSLPPQRIHVVLNWFEELKARVPVDN